MLTASTASRVWERFIDFLVIPTEHSGGMDLPVFSVQNLIGLICSVLLVTVVFGIIWFIKGYVSRRIAGAFKKGNI